VLNTKLLRTEVAAVPEREIALIALKMLKCAMNDESCALRMLSEFLLFESEDESGNWVTV
jgi:hypothetical protein